MYPPYVTLLVLRRFPAFFLARLPPFLGLLIFVGIAFFGLPPISTCLTRYERNNRRSEMLHTKREAQNHKHSNAREPVRVHSRFVSF